MNPLVLWLAGLLILGGVWLNGRQAGVAAERTRWEARASVLATQRATAQAEARVRAEQIIRLAEARAAALAEFEEQDRASPTADHPALGLDAVRRLRATP